MVSLSHKKTKFISKYMDIIYKKEELGVLQGLPHLQQLLYLKAIRPYMDYKTGMVGIKRGVSYQSFAEELYVEPHSGIQSGSPSRDQLRRALQGLARAGLIKLLSKERKLVLECCFVKQHKSNQNQAAINPPEDLATGKPSTVVYFTGHSRESSVKPALAHTGEPAIPLSNNNFILLQQVFAEFWQAYPVKQSKQKAWEVFQDLAPDKPLQKTMLKALEKQKQAYKQAKQHQQWVPNWKHPANWLRQHCWEDEIVIENPRGQAHGNYQRSGQQQSPSSLLWESCRHGFDTEEHDNTSTRILVKTDG